MPEIQSRLPEQVQLVQYAVLPDKVAMWTVTRSRFSFEVYNKSEGAIGIARTFLALGAPLVVASQWQVDSDSTKDLMIEFHLNRTQKRMSSVESLRQAQLAMKNSGAKAAPFYWAAFSLFGAYGSY